MPEMVCKPFFMFININKCNLFCIKLLSTTNCTNKFKLLGLFKKMGSTYNTDIKKCTSLEELDIQYLYFEQTRSE